MSRISFCLFSLIVALIALSLTASLHFQQQQFVEAVGTRTKSKTRIPPTKTHSKSRTVLSSPTMTEAMTHSDSRTVSSSPTMSEAQTDSNSPQEMPMAETFTMSKTNTLVLPAPVMNTKTKTKTFVPPPPPPPMAPTKTRTIDPMMTQSKSMTVSSMTVSTTESSTITTANTTTAAPNTTMMTTASTTTIAPSTSSSTTAAPQTPAPVVTPSPTKKRNPRVEFVLDNTARGRSNTTAANFQTLLAEMLSIPAYAIEVEYDQSMGVMKVEFKEDATDSSGNTLNATAEFEKAVTLDTTQLNNLGAASVASIAPAPAPENNGPAPADDDKMPLIIGLSVGCGLLFILVILLVLKKQQGSEGTGFTHDAGQAPQQSDRPMLQVPQQQQQQAYQQHQTPPARQAPHTNAGRDIDSEL